ncbi:(2,3-dihydroxybenzoyl)adenylate synthase [Gordonia oryzae]|uniref:(2,3-dihydroxybenzoyl)adenylate synthase n=1 Tax=Gordonia oryzae TaxID=2487349 RepID=A0A3N4GAT8_9ACTN|nr:AMP-binding protein [Gordonia oryzae]RPA59038.1 (2,3-dihydroxybenzoyl)adenylate synthase [Gordonia oryzae]
MKLTQWQDDVEPFDEADAARYREVWGSATIGQELAAQATRTPDALALIGPDRSLTYRELDDETDRIGAGLLDAGLRPGAAVMLQLDNDVATVVAWYALMKAALIPVCTLSAHRGNEIRQIAAQTHAAGHIVQLRHRSFDLLAFARSLAEQDGSQRLVFPLDDAPGSLMTAGADLSPERVRELVDAAQAQIDPDDVAVFQLSGGTTGVPKVIPRQHQEYWYNALAWAQRLGWESDVRVLHIVPLVHNAGIVCALHAAHAVGGAFVIGRPDPDDMLDVMTRLEITDMLIPPGLAAGIVAHPGLDAATRSLRRITMGGSEISDAVFEAFESRGVPVLNMFGMGEGLCMVSPLGAPRSVRQHGIGTPLSRLDEVRVLRLGEEVEVDDGVVGELCARGPYTIRGYLAAPERNAVAFTSDGFYRTGDLVARHQWDGGVYYTFEGRAKDLVNRGGEKISAAEVEGLVIGLPGLRRAALVAVPDERLGERGCLCVELEPTAPELTLDQIRRHLDDREVAKFKWPERLEHFDSLPTTPSAKIDKVRLSVLVAERSATSTTSHTANATTRS